MKHKIKKKIFSILIVLFLFFSIDLKASEHSIYTLTSKQLEYLDDSLIIKATGSAKAYDQFGKELFSDEIIYDKKKAVIKTNKNSIYKDKKGNKIFADEFYYDLNLKLIIANGNVKYFDNLNNQFNFDEFKYSEKDEIGNGKNMKALLNDKSKINSNYALINNIKNTILLNNKNYYTSCISKDGIEKNIEDECPDWSFVSEKSLHDRNEKMVYHYNSFIKLGNVPVFYTPYFSHPDPTVKRKSGILPPSTKNFSDLGRTLKTPYFWVISEAEDLTLTPVYYFDQHPMLMAEYRKQNKNSKLYLDTSFTEGYKNTNTSGRTGGSRNHIFFNFLGSYDDLIFQKNDMEINIQRVSQKNYLKVNEINTNFIKQDITTLQNNIIINSYENQKKLKVQGTIYENLNTPDNKYSYEIPVIEYADKIYKYDQFIDFKNTFLAKNFDTNSKQTRLINEINSTSQNIISDKIGLGTTYKMNFSNINVHNENISGKKENLNIDNFFTFGIENSLPLVKFANEKEEIISPKIFIKHTTGSMVDSSSGSKTLTYQDIFSMNRMNQLDNPETGTSLGYGIEYETNNRHKNGTTYFKNNFYIGQVLRYKKINEMPVSSSLNQKSSDIVGQIDVIYNPNTLKQSETFENTSNNDGFYANYNFILTNDLDKLLQNNLNINYNQNKNIELKLSYNESHDYIGNTQKITAQLQKKIKNNISFGFGGIKNLQDKYTESNFLELIYDSDCLRIGLNLSKNFYNNEDVRPVNNLTFSIMLKPFGQPISPDLNSFFNFK